MKKILFITNYNPFDPYSGASQRSRLILDALAENNTIDLVCFTPEEYNNSSIKNCSIKYFGPLNFRRRSKLKNMFNSLRIFSIYSLYSKDFDAERIISNIRASENYDFIVIRYVSLALKCGLYKGSNIIIDIDDLPEQWFYSFFKNSNLPLYSRLHYGFKSILAKYYTKRIIKNVYHSFLPNLDQVLNKNSSYLPNIPYPSHKEKNLNGNISMPTVLFVGSMSYAPNYLGIDYFLKNIWPQIKKRIPEAKLNIAGRNLPVRYQEVWEEHVDVNLLGFIEDINDEYAKNKVVIVPIYQGAGTNIKVLEAMKLQKTTVISQYAARGFQKVLKDNQNTLIAQNDGDFANKVVLALQDEELNSTIGHNAKIVVDRHFSYTNFKKRIQLVLND